MNLSGRARGGGSAFPAQSNAPRQNEYFVPRDGIDREVITADICRYLGNDALVRPGVHTDDAGRVIQGYYITAYRNLTSAMIADLKNDSARWDAERRKHQSGAVRYQDSQIRDGPQRGIGGGGGGSYGMPSSYREEYNSGLHYPGSDAPGYSGSGPAGPGHFASGGLGGYGGGQYSSGPPQQPQYAAPQAAAQDPRFGGPPAPLGGIAGGYGAGNNGALNAPIGQEPYSSGAHYVVAPSRDQYPMDMAMTDAPMAPARRTSPPGGAAPFGNPGNNARVGYGNVPGAATGGYGGYAPPAANLGGASYAQPIDNGYGRAPNNTNSGFSSAHELPQQTQQAQQYEDPPAFPPSPTRAAGPVATTTQAQLSSNSGPTAGPRRDQARAVRESSDHRDRDRIDRPTDRDRDRERDATPPNRTGSATKSGNSSHHHYGRR